MLVEFLVSAIFIKNYELTPFCFIFGARFFTIVFIGFIVVIIIFFFLLLLLLLLSSSSFFFFFKLYFCNNLSRELLTPILSRFPFLVWIMAWVQWPKLLFLYINWDDLVKGYLNSEFLYYGCVKTSEIECKISLFFESYAIYHKSHKIANAPLWHMA